MTNYILIAIPLFFLLMVVEYIAMRLQKKEVYRLNDTLNDLSCGVMQQITGAFVKAILFTAYIYIYTNYAIWDIPNNIASWVILFLGVDFLYYWFHRFSHRVNAPWAAHIVHHQSEEFNLAVALRQGTFQSFFSWFFYLPLALMGFHPYMMATTKSLNTLYQFWIHTRLVGKLGFLESFLNTPSHHRVHHGRNPQYLDKNYAGVFIIWDRMFNTFIEEKEEPAYGITKPLNSWNPLWANFHYWIELFTAAKQTNSFLDKLKIWFMPPGWKPRDFQGQKVERNLYARYDPQVPTGIKLYISFHFFIILLSTVYLLKNQTQLSELSSYSLAGLIFYSLVVTGFILDKKRLAITLESVRLLFFSIFVLTVFPSYLSVGWSLVPVGFLCFFSLVWFIQYREIFIYLTNNSNEFSNQSF